MSVLMLLLALGCGETPAPKTNAVPTQAASTASHAAVLAKADAKDGTVDKVVAQCSGCSLAMEGNPLHAVKVEDYELHFCSESCANNFEGAPDKGIAAMEKAVTH